MPQEQAKEYHIIPTQEGILAIAIAAQADEPVKPRLVYDGGKNALFYRKPDETVILDYLDEHIHQTLAKAREVMMVEIHPELEQVVRSYRVPVSIVPMMPPCTLDETI